MKLDKQKMSPLQIAYEVLAGLGLLVHLVLIARAWASLPSTIPVHYGFSGQPDAWGGKIELLELPVVSVLLYFGLTLLARYPHKFNYPWTINERNSEQQYRLARSLVGAVKGLLVWLFAVLSWQTIRAAMGQTGGLGGAFVPVILGITGLTVIVYVLLARSAAQA